MSTQIKLSLKTIVKGAGVIFFSMVIGSLLGVVNQALMGRFLGPGNYGLFTLGISVMSIFCLLPQFGFVSALTQFIPYNIKKNRFDKAKAGISFALKFSMIVGIFASLVLFLLSREISTKLFHNKELEVAIKILCIALPFWAFHRVSGAAILGFKKPEYYASIENIIMKIIQLAIFIFLIFLGFRLSGALFAYICATILTSVAYFYILTFKLYPLFNLSSFKHNQRKEPVGRELILLAWPLFSAGLTLFFANHTDKLLLGFYTSSADIGVYAAAFTIATLVLFVFTSFSLIFRPVISEYFAMKDIIGMKNLFSSVTKWIFMLTFPIVLYLFFYSKDVIFLIYGESFTKGSFALIILSIGIAMNGLTGLTGEILIAIRKTKLNLLADIIGAVSNVGLNIILIPKLGITGAAIGTSLSFSFRNIASLAFVYKELKIHPYNFKYINIILNSIISFVLISFLFKYFLDSFWTCIFIVLPFSALYITFLFITGSLDEFDKYLIKAILRKVYTIPLQYWTYS